MERSGVQNERQAHKINRPCEFYSWEGAGLENIFSGAQDSRRVKGWKRLPKKEVVGDRRGEALRREATALTERAQ